MYASMPSLLNCGVFFNFYISLISGMVTQFDKFLRLRIFMCTKLTRLAVHHPMEKLQS